MVTELRCREEGCPPLETVIAVIGADRQKRIYKIHKPITEITEASLLESLVHTPKGKLP